jgi:predicted nucleic acid-binding protein
VTERTRAERDVHRRYAPGDSARSDDDERAGVEDSPRRRALDLAIAATATVHSVPLLTQNASDFQLLDDLVDVRSP